MKYARICAATLLAASFAAYPGGALVLNDGVLDHPLYFNPEYLSNEPGTIFQTDWNSGVHINDNNYYIACTAKDNIFSGFFWSSTLLVSDATSGEWHSLDEHWDIKIEIQMVSAGIYSYQTVPFYNYKTLPSNGYASFLCKGAGNYLSSQLSASGSGMGFASGQKGRLSLKLKKKIVNGYSFISRPIAMLYGALNDSPNLNKPFMRVVIEEFEIILPEKCEINAGQIIEIEFGDVPTTKLDGEHYPVRSAFDVTCSGGDFDSGLSSVSAEFIGNSTAFSSDYFATDHSGIGIKVKDEANNIIRPQDKKTVNLVNGHKKVPLVFTPVAESKNIDAGEFNANIIVRMLIE